MAPAFVYNHRIFGNFIVSSENFRTLLLEKIKVLNFIGWNFIGKALNQANPVHKLLEIS